jgi:hypothetical protein
MCGQRGFDIKTLIFSLYWLLICYIHSHSPNSSLEC